MNARVNVLAVMAEDAEFIENMGESGSDLLDARAAVSDLASVAFAVVASGGSDAQLIERLKRSLEDGGFVRIDRSGGAA